MIDLNEKPLCTIPRVMCWAVDNMELLKSQPDESVDLIYCDILYGTGRNFGDYQDLNPIRSEIENHYIPRIKEMHRILKQTGSIYLQMDWRINYIIREILDSIFTNNLINEIIWVYPKSIKNSIKKELCNHDTIFHYSKTNNFYIHNIQLEGYTDKQLKRFKNEDENGKYYFDTRRDNEGNKKKVKVYLTKEGTPLGDVWYFNFAQGKENIGYATQKPKALIERIIKASSNEGDTVADYYLGSGTTAVVCKELNRNFIGCDINPKAIELTKTRLNAGT